MFPKDCTIAGYDDELAKAIADEGRRQEDHVELIASENISRRLAGRTVRAGAGAGHAGHLPDASRRSSTPPLSA